jgi:hypothetical protein
MEEGEPEPGAGDEFCASEEETMRLAQGAGISYSAEGGAGTVAAALTRAKRG